MCLGRILGAGTKSCKACIAIWEYPGLIARSLQRVHSSPRRALDVQMVQYDDPWKMGPVSGDLHYDCDYHDLDNTTELGSHAIVKHGLVTPPLSTASVIPLAPCQAPNTPGPTAYVMCNDYDECQLVSPTIEFL